MLQQQAAQAAWGPGGPPGMMPPGPHGMPPGGPGMPQAPGGPGAPPPGPGGPGMPGGPPMQGPGGPGMAGPPSDTPPVSTAQVGHSALFSSWYNAPQNTKRPEKFNESFIQDVINLCSRNVVVMQ